MKTTRVKTKDGQTHTIDSTGNHFIGTKCVNPTCASGMEIGDTYPEQEDIFKTY